MLRRLALDHPRLRPVSEPNAGQPNALLAGARVADSEVILLLDDDVVPVPGIVVGYAAHHAEETGLLLVGYMPVPAAPSTRRSWARDIYARTYEQHCRAWEAHPDTVLQTLWAGHISMRRADLLAIASGPRGYHNDLNLGLCAAAAGLRGRCDRHLGSRHLFERSPEGSAANALDSGKGQAEIRANHGAAGERSAISPLPRAVGALVRRPRGDAALEALLRTAVSALGALRVFRLQRFAAGRLWQVLQARGFAQRARELHGVEVAPAEARA